MSPHDRLLEHMMALAHSVPESVLFDVARKIEQQGTSVSPPSAMVIASDIAQPAYRAAVARFMNAWVDDDVADAPPTGIAWGLRAAARTITRERAQESVALKVRLQGRQRNSRYPNTVVRSISCVASPWQYGQPIVRSSIHLHKRRRIPEQVSTDNR